MEMNQVTLPVKNMEEAVKFYLVLGFIQIVDTPHYARFSCPKGNSTFSLSLELEEFKNGAIIYFETDAYFGESERSFRFYPITFSSSFSSLPVLP
jgi:catechol 2,3-dioxygenase-like lactoylglutathione lyase family enzyme